MGLLLLSAPGQQAGSCQIPSGWWRCLYDHHQRQPSSPWVYRMDKDADCARAMDGSGRLPDAAQARQQGSFSLDEATAKMNEILMNADPFRFNAGRRISRRRWRRVLEPDAMVDYVGGKSAAEVLRGCQEVWDNLK